ncbi:hypothetical protein [Pararhizobium sp.]|uniref:hypothetical protein n=1 Tax=Pararhizobium sp. TaxID=1977563 RepID=UPI00271B1DC8|nr:hypothetical protein [Pararhizobium sp.]MDO9416368.1 hypothetical protein [Pararhizobium sp.]
MHYTVQLFSWTPREGVHQVGSTFEIDALNPKNAAISLLGLRLDEDGNSNRLAARVWSAATDATAECSCYYYH